MKKAFALQWCLISLMIPVSGYAEKPDDNQNFHDLIKQQQTMLEQQQKEIDALRQLVLQQQDQTNQRLDKTADELYQMKNVTLKLKKAAKSTSKIKISKKGFRIQSKKRGYSFRAGGRIHADYAYYDDDVTGMGSGMNLRRARLYFKGKFFHDWRYKAEIDFAERGNVGPRGVWLSYQGWKPVSLKLGNFQEPFSLEEMSGSNTITFMERSLANTFSPSYHLGIGAKGYGESWSVSGGVFGDTIRKKDDAVDDGWGVAGRTTFAPLLSDHTVLHVGFSGEYRQTDTARKVRIRTHPESAVTNRRLVDTRTIRGVDSSWRFGGEFAALYGPVSLQGEYIHTQVVRNQARNLDFNGGYIQGSWFLTGESRPYHVKQGVFGMIHPRQDYGAWELALRYSWIDLDDHDITGGKENDFTLGLNWYANYNMRFMMNYIFVDAHPNRDGVDENPNIFQMRGQFVF